MPASENVEIVRSALQAAESGGIEAGGAFVHEDFEMGHLPGRPDAEVYRGWRAAMLTMSERVSTFDEIRAAPESFSAVGDDHVVVAYHERGKPRGGSVEVEHLYGILYALREGKIARMAWFDSPGDALRAAAEASDAPAPPSHGEPQPQENPGPPTADDLQPTWFIDSDSDTVRGFVERLSAGASGDHEIVARLFAGIRDGVRYDPYKMPAGPGEYRASAVIEAGSGYCVQKAVALTAVARAAGIPSRLGFSDVRNHLQSERLAEAMGSDLFVWHGYSTFFVGGRWTKASPAFNAELCARFGVPPLEFDGTHDALLHAFTGDGTRHMEYVHERGVYVDLPLEAILAGLREAYPTVG